MEEEFGFDAVVSGYGNPTSIQFVETADGQDLMITSQQNGVLSIWLVESTGVGENKDFFVVGNSPIYQTSIVNDIPNHNDDGTLNAGLNNRQVTGLIAEIVDDGNGGETIELYVSSSDPRIGGGGEANVDDKGIDTNSGVLSKLTFDVPSNVQSNGWDVSKVDLVRGIPRSEENHSVNGMDFLPNGNLLLSVGGFTNSGAPSQNLVYTPEYYLSAAIIEIDVNTIEGLDSQFENGQEYKYDLPTLGILREERDGDVDGEGFAKNATNPFGGNDGYNQAYLEQGGPIEIFATGFRNAYDVEVVVLQPGDVGYVEGSDTNYRVYTWDNGANNNWGDPSVDANGVPVTAANANEADNVPVLENNTPVSPGAQDQLHLVEKGGYYGSPNPSRANPNAILYLKPEIEGGGFEGDADPAPEFTDDQGNVILSLRDFLPNEANGDPLNGFEVTNLEGFYLKPATGGNSPDGALVLNNGSTNGIVVIDGDLYATGFDEQILRVELSDDGATALNRADIEANNAFAPSQGANPLDITEGPDGSIFIAAHGGNNIFALVPGGVLPGETSNDDDDNLNDTLDPFQLDPDNGLGIDSKVSPGEIFEFTMENEVGAPNGLSGFVLGLTGHQLNYDTEYFTNASGVITGGVLDGGIAGKLQIEFDAVGDGTAIGPVSEGQGNDLTYALQSGINYEDASSKILIESTMTNPWFGASPENGQSMGIYFGTGTQFDFAQFNFGVNSSGQPVVQITIELNDQVAFSQEIAAPGLFQGGDTDMVMRVVVDRDTNEVTPSWSYIDGNGVTQTGSTQPISLEQGVTGNSLVEAIQGAGNGGYFARGAPEDGEQGQILFGDLVGEFGAPLGLAVGINGRVDTINLNNAFAPEFDNLLITASDASGNFAPQVEDEIAGEIAIGETLIVNAADLLANDTDFGGATLFIESVQATGGGTAQLINGGTQIEYTPSGLGESGFTYVVSNGSQTAEGKADITVTPPAGEGVVVYRVNAGQGTIAAVDGGPDWLGDTVAGPNGAAQYLTGTTANTFAPMNTDEESEITLGGLDGFVPWQIFAGERSDNPTAAPTLQYTFPVSDGGNYEITVYYTENWTGITSDGGRVFDVAVNGVIPPVFDDLDPYAESNGQTGVAQAKVYTITADSDTLVLDFLHGPAQNPKVNGIQIKQLGVETPAPSINVTDVTVVEGGDLFFDISRDGDDSEAIEVAYEIVPDTAQPGVDYEVLGETPDGAGVISGTVTIAASSSDQSVLVSTIDNEIPDGTRSFTINLTSIVSGDAVIGAGSATGTITDDDFTPGEVLFAINAGGSTPVTIDGITFDPDTAGNNHPNLDLSDATAGSMGTGNNTNNNGAAETFVNVDGTPFTGDTTLFTSERWTNDFGYDFVVPNGDYTVEIYLAETFQGVPGTNGEDSGVGARLFDISIEGEVVADQVDLYDEGDGTLGNDAGQPLVPIIKTFDVTVTDGVLNIDLDSVGGDGADNAKISALVVRAAGEDTVPAVVSIEDAGEVQETGDTGVTTLDFPVAFSKTADEAITVEYTVSIDGEETTGLSAALGTDGGTISVDVPNDDDGNGTESVTVTLTGITVGTDSAALSPTASSATGTVTEDELSPTPTDIDGDGLTNVDDPFAYDSTNGDAKALLPGGEFLQDFNTDTTNPFSAEGGFSGIILNPVVDPAGSSETDPYGDRTIEAGTNITGGNLTIDSTNTDVFGTGVGDQQGGANNQIQNNYQSAADVTGVDTFEIVAQAANPFFGGDPAQNAFASFGITLGAGGTDDYVKFVLGGSGQGPRIQIGQENSLTGVKEENLVTQSQDPALDSSLAADIVFRLAVDTVAGTVQGIATFLDENGAEIGEISTSVRTIDPAGSLAAAIAGNNPLTGGDGGIAYGISITDWGAAPSFTGSWDYLRLTATDDVPEVALSIVDAVPSTEVGDEGTTALTFGITADSAVSGDVEVTANVDLGDGSGPQSVTQTVTLTDGAGFFTVDVPNDDDADGTDTVSVALTAVGTGFSIEPTAASATGELFDDEFGVPYDEANDGDLSDDNLSPTEIQTGIGDNIVTAEQQGAPEDRDFFTITIEEGQVLSQIVLNDWQGGADDPGFIGFMAGDQFTADPTTLENDPSANPAALGVLGGYVYGESDLGTDLLPNMNSLGFVGFEQPLPPGDYTFWLNQNGGQSEATLNFVIDEISAISIGDAPEVVEAGDEGTTALEFPLTLVPAVEDTVVVTYTVDGGEEQLQIVTFDGSGAGTLTVAVPNDAADNGTEIVSVTVTGSSSAQFVADAVANTASGSVTEDDTLDAFDIDGDGTLNTDDPFAFDGTNGDANVLAAGGEIRQDFDVDTTNPFSDEAGFEGILVNPAFDPPGTSAEDPYGDRTTEAGVSIANGVLSVTSSNTDTFQNGIGDGNTIKDNYQNSVDVTGVDSFVVESLIANPFGDSGPLNFGAVGITLGAGGTDDWVKLVFGGATQSGNVISRIELAHNNSLVGNNESIPLSTSATPINIADIADILVQVFVDKAAGENGQLSGLVTFLDSDGEEIGSLATSTRDIAPGGSLFAALNGENPLTGGDGGLAYGISITDWGPQQTFVADFDYLTIYNTDDVTAPAAVIAPVDPIADSDAPVIVAVTFSDDVAIDASSIAEADLTLSGPGLVAPVPADEVDYDTETGVATFTFNAPEEGWENGAFTADLAEGSVLDTSGNGVAAASTAVTIADPIEVSIVADLETIVEANGAVATFTITLDQPPADGETVEVAYTVGGTATPDVDYVPPVSPVTFAAGETSKVVSIALINDAVVEQPETITVDLTGATLNGADLPITTGSATTTTALETEQPAGSDDDETFDIIESDENVEVGGGANTVTGSSAELDELVITGFDEDDEVLIEDAPTAKIVDVREGSTILGISTDGDDSTEELTIVFDDLPPLANNRAYTPEDFDVVDNGDGSNSIVFDPIPYTGTISLVNPNGTELSEASEDALLLFVQLSEAATEDVTVSFELSGTAEQDVDYLISSNGTVTIAAGQTMVPLILEVLNDTAFEELETIQIDLIGATLGESENISGVIDVDSSSVLLTLQSDDPDVPPPSDPVNLEAEDFTSLNGFFVQPSGAASGFELIRLPTNGAGTASTELPAGVDPGLYTVVIHYFDENDGQMDATIEVNGSPVAGWTFDNDGPSPAASTDNLRTATFNEIALDTGDIFSISAAQEDLEFGRIDRVEFIRTADLPVDLAPTGDVEDTSVTEGDAVNIPLAFVDPEGEDVAYELASGDENPLPEWLSIVDGAIVGTPPVDAAGTSYVLQLTATDPALNATVDVFTLTIEDNTGPAAVVEVTPPATQADPIVVTVTLTDASAIDSGVPETETIDLDDVSLTGALDVAQADSVQFDPSTGIVTYTFNPPVDTGLWPAGDYSAVFADGAIADVFGNLSDPVLPTAFEVAPDAEPTDGRAVFTANLDDTNVTGSSTFGNQSMVITNESTNGVTIETVVFDFSTTLIPDVVFDPDDGSPAGDTANKSFTLGSAVGVDAPAVQYGSPLGAGFLTMTLDFTAGAQAFDNGDSIAFGMDVDPISAYSPLGGGAVSGQEIAGGTFTVTFSDGTTATGSILPQGGGFVGGIATADTAKNLLVPPSIALVTELDPTTDPTVVNQAAQTITVDAGIENAGQTIRLFVLDTAFYVQGGGEGPDLTGNSTNTPAVTVDAEVGLDGTVTVPVTLTRVDNGSVDDDLNLGINYITAVLLDEAGEPGPASNALTVEFDPNAVIADDSLAPNGDLDGDEIVNVLDPDVDGDTIPNVDDAFSYDADNGVLIAEGEMIELTFDIDGTPYQNGLTGLLQGAAGGFEEDTGTAVVENGKLLVTANNGDTGGQNNPSDDFQIGVKNANFTVEARIDNPFQTTPAQNFDQLGVHVGLDSTNFVKLVFGFAAGVVEFSIQTDDVETKATGGNQALPTGVTLADFAYADLSLTSQSTSDSAATLQASISFYSADGTPLAENVPYGQVPVTGALAAALADPDAGVGVGFTQTQFGGTDAPFVAALDNLKVTANGEPAPADDVDAILAAIDTPAAYTNGEVGEAEITIIPGGSIQQSNFGPNSFEVTNTGDKNIAAVFIDVRGALYPDSVFDPDGLGGDSVAKPWAVNTDGGTGGFVQGSGYFLPGADPVAGPSPSNGGFKGAIVQFSDFNTGETVGFSGDMDPNSIAGLTKASVDTGAINGWDVGGVSGAELTGSTVYILFDDGSIATSQLIGDGSQGGSHAKISEAPATSTATLTVNTDVPGEYGETAPEVVVTGTPGDTVRVMLTKGFNPVTNPDVADLVADRLASQEFEANNAFEFQYVDVEIPGSGSVDITNDFNYASGAFNGADTSPIGFVAAVIDGDGFAAGPVTEPIYLVSNGTPVDPLTQIDGFYLVEDGRLKVQVEDFGTEPGSDWTYFDSADEEGNQSNFQGSGYYEWKDGGYGPNGEVLDPIGLNPPQGILTYQFFIPEGQEGDYQIRIRGSRDSGTPGDQRNDIWIKIDDDAEALLTNETDAVSNSGFIKLFMNSNGNFGFGSAIDSVSEEEPNFTGVVELEAGLHTIQLAGRSAGFHVDFFELFSGSTPPLGASDSVFVPTGPTEPTVADPIDDQQVALTGDAFSFTVPAGTFQDLDGDTLTLTADAPEGVAFDPNTGTFTGTPTAGVGEYPITVTATDNDNNFVTDTFILSVVDQVVVEGFQAVTVLNADDVELGSSVTSPDLETNKTVQIRLTVEDGVSNITSVESAVISWISERGQGGTSQLTFQVVDTKSPDAFGNGKSFVGGSETVTIGQSWSDNQTINNVVDIADLINALIDSQGPLNAGNTIFLQLTGTGSTRFIEQGSVVLSLDGGTTVGNPGDTVPTVEDPLDNVTIAADGQLTFTVPANTFADADGDTLTLSASTPAGVGFNPNTGQFSGAPNAGPGTYDITVFADDEDGNTISDTFQLTVLPPVESDIVLRLIDPVNDTVIQTFAPTDVLDPSVLLSGEYALDVLYNGNGLGSVTFSEGGVVVKTENFAPYTRFPTSGDDFLGGPLPAEGSTLDLLIQVWSQSNGSGSVIAAQSFAITVGEDTGGGNTAPVVQNALDDVTITDEDSLSIPLNSVFFDADGDALTLDLNGEPNGLAIVGNAIVGTPTAGAGIYTFLVTASDGQASASDTLTLTVTSTGTENAAPVVSNPIPNLTITEGDAVSIPLSGVFFDPDGDPLTLSLIGAPNGIDIQGGTIVGTPTAGAGTYSFAATASDGEFSASDTFVLTVEEDIVDPPENDIVLLLRDPVTDAIVRELTTNDVISTQELLSGEYTLEAQYTGSGNVESIRFLDDDGIIKNENFAPYAITNDNSGTDFEGLPLPSVGTMLNITIEAYTGNNGAGTTLESVDFSLTIIDTPPGAASQASASMLSSMSLVSFDEDGAAEFVDLGSSPQGGIDMQVEPTGMTMTEDLGLVFTPSSGGVTEGEGPTVDIDDGDFL